MEDVWFISDPHFGHSRIIEYSSRPFANVDEMNEKMVQNWNELVKPGDRVYCNGDVAFMPYDKFRAFIWRLNGNIHLVLGNHDKMIIENKNDLLKQGRFATIQHYNELKIAGQNDHSLPLRPKSLERFTQIFYHAVWAQPRLSTSTRQVG